MTSTAGITGEEMFESLNGFEEIAIEKSFNVPIGDLAERKPTMFLRACVFAHLRRGGASDAVAYQECMEKSLRECDAYFDAEPEEIDPDVPETPVGEGDAPSE